MQFERDMIQIQVLPELNEYVRSYGESIHFVDLRWGVNTLNLDSEDGAKKVLSVCLDQIDSCKPYMIILLGERYGWIPDAKLLKNAALYKDYDIDDFEKSVTALEIEYGALSDRSIPERCLFYFREPLCLEEMTEEEREIYGPESEEHSKRLSQLKKKIKDRLGENVRYYSVQWDKENKKITGLDTLGKNIYEDVKRLMEDEFKSLSELSWQQKDQLGFNLFIDEKCRNFSARYDLIDQYMKEILDDNTKLFLLTGKSGSGKSTIISKLIREIEGEKLNVFPFICGNSTRSSSAIDFVYQAVYYLEELLGIKSHFGQRKLKIGNESYQDEDKTFNQWMDRFTTLIYKYDEKCDKQLVFVVDALDQLTLDEITENFMWLPENIPSKIKIVASCINSFKLPLIMPYPKNQVIEELSELKKDQTLEVIKGILKAQGKELGKKVIASIAKKQSSSNPLYLSFLIQRLLMLDSDDFNEIAHHGNDMKAIDEYLKLIVEKSPEKLDAMCVTVLKEAGERINNELVEEALALLAYGRRGLGKSDLEGIFKQNNIAWSTLDFARLLKYMKPFFCTREDGRIDFTHNSIRLGITKELEEGSQEYNHKIFNWLRTLPNEDGVKLEEIIWYAFLCDEKQYTVDLINELYENNIDLYEISKAMKEVCIKDKGKWFLSIVQNGKSYGCGNGFVKFCNHDVNYVFQNSKEEIEIIYPILNETLQLARDLSHCLNNTDADEALALTLREVGYTLNEQERFAEALEIYKEALSINRELVKVVKTPEAFMREALILIDIGQVLETLDKLDEAAESYRESCEIYKKLAEELNDADIYRCVVMSKGMYARLVHDEEEAMSTYYYMIDICRKFSQGIETSDLYRDEAITLTNIGDILIRKDKLKEAQQFYEEALVIFRELLKEFKTPYAYRDVAIGLRQLGYALAEQRKFKKSLETYEESLQIFRSLAEELKTPKYYRFIAAVLYKIGDVLQEQKKLKKSLEIHKEAVAIYRDLARELNTRESYIDLKNCLDTLCADLISQKRINEVEHLFYEAHALDEFLYPEEDDSYFD